MEAAGLIPLSLLYTRNRQAIQGTTRFQKLVFLLQEEGEVPVRYQFHADNFGPFSPALQDDLTHLDKKGLIEQTTTTNEIGHERHTYSITPQGIGLLRRIDQSLDPLFEESEAIKERFGEQPLQDVLRYVYRKYPEYAVDSELDLDRLFDPDARSQFLEPDTEPEYIGTEPGEWKDMNPTAEELFSTESS